MRQRSPERRAEILRVATALFAAQGFEATTTRQIADQVGVSEPILYRHFPTKRQLLLAVLEDYGPGRLWQERSRALRGGPVTEALRELLVSYLDMTWDNLPLFRVLWLESRHDAELLALVRAQYQAIRSSLTQMMDRAASAGEIRPELAQAGVEVIGLALRGCLGRLATRRPTDWPAERDTLVDQLLAVVMEGLVPRVDASNPSAATEDEA